MGRYKTGPQAGQTVPGSLVPEKPPAPSEASLAMAAANGDPQATEALRLLRDKQPASEWADLSPVQQQEGFARFTTLKADPAAQRQWAAISAQVAQQGRAQTFTEQQTGRKELTDKVELPYQTAISGASTLRDVVQSAQAGNKVAASLQALETTFAAVRAQGLNRVNMAEIGLPANAGNTWDHIQSWFGKKVEGQPVPADIQKDMLQFADILEKAAYKKYTEGHTTITKRYGLTDEKPLPAPASATPTAPSTLSPGLDALKKR